MVRVYSRMVGGKNRMVESKNRMVMRIESTVSV